MKTVVLTIAPKNTVHPLVDGLLEAGVAIAPDRPGQLIVEGDRADTVMKFFRMHGHTIEKKEERLLKGAVEHLAEFIRLDDKKEEAPKRAEQQIGRRKLMTFIQRRIRDTRKGMNRRRAQHVRDEMSGKIRAYEDILRRLKKS